jgi:serine/threonine-protein kinase HipA
MMLDALLRQQKIDRNDLFGQLVTVGRDLVGAVTVEEIF